MRATDAMHAPRYDARKIEELFAERILVLDGAMGTTIQRANLSLEDDFEGHENCSEILNRTRPDFVRGVHRAYLDAGADVVETNSFGSTPTVLAEFGLEAEAEALSKEAALLARAEAEEAEARKAGGKDGPRLVAGSMGPTTKTLSVTGGITFDELAESFRVQARGLLAGGVEILLIETAQDARNVKAALVGIRRAFRDLATTRPIAVSATIEPMGTTLAGQEIDAFYVSVEHAKPLYVGMNCATGPGFMRDHLRTLSEIARTRTAAVPNAGLPDEEGNYGETPENFARTLAEYVEAGFLNAVGGCCGTTAEHIARLVASVAGKSPRVPASYTRTQVSGISYFAVEDEVRPVHVGERTNVLGSRKFKRLVAEGKWEEAAEVGRAQVRAGAQILDVCLQDPDRDEAADMDAFLARLTRLVKVPLMIDSTDAAVVETALRWCQGKAIVNSVNLEDGEKRFEEVVPLLREYGAAVVVGCIDEEGQAREAAKKEAIAVRSYELLTKKYGIPGEDVFIDPLVFPVGTGDEAYIGAGAETIEAVRRIKKALPDAKTVIGLSNVSFGLPPAGREVLNAVYLHHCVEAGLDVALVNTEGLERYAQISKEEKKLCDDLIFLAPGDLEGAQRAVAAFTEYFRGKSGKKQRKIDRSGMPVEERLAAYVVAGTKEGLLDDLEEILSKGARPLEVINGPLMKGMAEVGRLFGENQLIVAEVLQSAEVMKAAVAYLTPKMERRESATKGKVVLATVKGDVHDIGKNLVEIILANNGFEVVNLGIKVPPEKLIEAARKEKPDIIGLSGLLVKSAQMMAVTAEDLARAGIEVPILVGGAALTEKFTTAKIQPVYKGPVRYARSAMEGLALAEEIVGGKRTGRVPAPVAVAARGERSEVARALQEDAYRRASDKAAAPLPRSKTPILDEVPRPPDLKRHVVAGDLDEIAKWVNLQMIYSKHMGLKGSAQKLLAAGDPKALELRTLFDDILAWGARGGIKPRAVFQFFRAEADGNRIRILAPDGRERAAFDFPRQAAPPYLCLSDYVRPKEAGEDFVCLFVTTAGEGIREEAERLKEKGEYRRSIALQAYAIELAEGFAEMLHAEIRRMWGFPDPPGTSIQDCFRAKYRGVRVSPGYPACPNLDDQAIFFELLKPEEIGVSLTEGMMMEPEASVSALVLHHPEGRYFSVERET